MCHPAEVKFQAKWNGEEWEWHRPLSVPHTLSHFRLVADPSHCAWEPGRPTARTRLPSLHCSQERVRSMFGHRAWQRFCVHRPGCTPQRKGPACLAFPCR